ncbi:Bacterio-opsin activator HTH domain protein (plasmid) [Haloterrigena turkmenica DSM 5511]|uniref:Bacterio-opsin activator HTH domain protein n=1 Tax=Haloterrigena turkmenica (strain ATCC 51198 / DSM 5511 / JCM 9101 / NCIMB 13204 / VKM B-1734 / 4k) TaxID=543526 RepID=D2S308_HALTV|nr:helix-turn-helix domain-containing protein [Haloterrigena turkmenica]ADB63755.1 Bacterio-opsin activator HTH domain protein [Haloterrigena turkmenica DSM 5511]
MGLIAEFRLTSLDLPLTDTVAAVPGITVYIERILVVDPDRPAVLCRVVDDRDGEFGAALANDPTVAEQLPLDKSSGSTLYRIKLRDPPVPIYRKYVELGTTPLAGIVTVDGWWGRARFPDREALAEFRTFCVDRGASFQLERLTRESTADDPPFGLTREQYEALVAARDAGYFAVPRKASTEEIGERLGISGPSASERLRRGIDRLLENAL